jgi:hypothetical protein
MSTCAKRKSPSPCLLAIPAFDRKTRLNDRHLNSNRGICLRYRFWSQAEGLDWSCQRLAPRWHWANCGRDKLCLVGCLGSEATMGQSQRRLFCRRLGEAAAPGRGGGNAGRAPTLHLIPWHLPYNWGKSRKTSVRVSERRSADHLHLVHSERSYTTSPSIPIDGVNRDKFAFFLLRKLHPDRPGTSTLPVSVTPHMLPTHMRLIATVISRTSGRPGTFTQSNALPDIGQHWREKHFHFYSWAIALISIFIFSEVASTVSVYFTKYAFNLNYIWFVRADSKLIQMLTTEWRA